MLLCLNIHKNLNDNVNKFLFESFLVKNLNSYGVNLFNIYKVNIVGIEKISKYTNANIWWGVNKKSSCELETSKTTDCYDL